MAVLTAAQKQEQFEHVMNVLLNRHPVTSALGEALSQFYGTTYQDTDNLLTLTEADIDTMTYDVEDTSVQPATKTTKDVLRGDKALLRIFRTYHIWRAQKQDPVDPLQWKSVTADEFRQFRTTEYWTTTMTLVTPPPSTNVGSTASKTPKQLFMAGVKKDPTIYPTLKEDHQFEDWLREATAIAASHDMLDVFTDHNPTTPAEVELFAVKQTTAYAMLSMKVQTTKGKTFVREHGIDRNAQKVIQKLTAYYRASTIATIEAGERLEYITSATFGTPHSKWRGNSRTFIDHWLQQIVLYEITRTDKAEHFSDAQKQAMLENAVRAVPELRRIKETANQIAQAQGTTQTTAQRYATYVKLLQSAAEQYDKDNSTSGGRTRRTQQRSVYVHDSHTDHDHDHDIDTHVHDLMNTYDIDETPTHHLEAYNTTQHRPVRLPRHDTTGSGQPRWALDATKFQKLSREAKQLWAKMNREDQDIIVKATDLSRGDPALAVHLLQQLYSVQLSDDDPPPEVSNVLEYIAHSTTTSPDESAGTSVSSPTTDTASSGISSNDERATLHPAALVNMMQNKPRPTRKKTTTIEQNVTYVVQKGNRLADDRSSLTDRGANGGVRGDDMRMLNHCASGRTVDIEGLDYHRVGHKRVGTAAGLAHSNQGDVILIFHQYADHGKGPSIHSSIQMEAHGVHVDEKSAKVGGTQSLSITCGNLGYVFPMAIVRGLARLPLRPPTDAELDTLPHIIMTGDQEWDPTIMDSPLPVPDTTEPEPDRYRRVPFSPIGEYLQRTVAQTVLDDNVEECVLASFDKPRGATWTSALHRLTGSALTMYVSVCALLSVAYRSTTRKPPNYTMLRPMFAWLPADVIESTFDRTTQYARVPGNTILHRQYKSPIPALNVPRRDEDVASDTIFGPVPAIDNGAEMAQLYCGTDSLVTDVYGMKTLKQFVNTLEDNIRHRGAMRRLLTDSAEVKMSNRVLDILRSLYIPAWQSEPDQQNQNPAERRINTIKTRTNLLMDRVAAPPDTWLLATSYVCDLLNHTTMIPSTISPSNSLPVTRSILAFSYVFTFTRLSITVIYVTNSALIPNAVDVGLASVAMSVMNFVT